MYVSPDVYVPPDFPCFYDIVGKDYNSKGQDTTNSLTTLRRYLEGALALQRAGGAYRTQKDGAAAAGEFDRCDTCNLAPPLATFSRSLRGKRRRTCDMCRAEKEAAAASEDEAWKAAGVPADLPALREAYAREQAAKEIVMGLADGLDGLDDLGSLDVLASPSDAPAADE